MKFRQHLLAVLILSTLSIPANAGLQVGAEIHPLNFFKLPSGTGLSTKSNFGLGSVHFGYSLMGTLDLNLFISSDNTGTITGTGTLFGSTGLFSGKFKVLSYGAEAKFSPPLIPFYLRAGFGLGSLTSDFSFNGSTALDPFSAYKMAYQAHGGLGFSLGLPVITLYAGLDAVYVKFKSTSVPVAATNANGLLYFRVNAGVTYSL